MRARTSVAEHVWRRLTPRARWWGFHLAIAALNVAIAAWLMFEASIPAGIANLMVALVLIIDRGTQRLAFRHGWYVGHNDALDEVHHQMHHPEAPSPIQVRSIATGYPAPEPWDRAPYAIEEDDRG